MTTTSQTWKKLLHGTTCNYLCPDSIWKNRCVCKKSGCFWKNNQYPSCMQQKIDDATDYQHGYKNQMVNDVQRHVFIYEEVFIHIKDHSWFILKFRKKRKSQKRLKSQPLLFSTLPNYLMKFVHKNTMVTSIYMQKTFSSRSSNGSQVLVSDGFGQMSEKKWFGINKKQFIRFRRLKITIKFNCCSKF